VASLSLPEAPAFWPFLKLSGQDMVRFAVWAHSLF